MDENLQTKNANWATRLAHSSQAAGQHNIHFKRVRLYYLLAKNNLSERKKNENKKKKNLVTWGLSNRCQNGSSLATDFAAPPSGNGKLGICISPSPSLPPYYKCINWISLLQAAVAMAMVVIPTKEWTFGEKSQMSQSFYVLCSSIFDFPGKQWERCFSGTEIVMFKPRRWLIRFLWSRN